MGARVPTTTANMPLSATKIATLLATMTHQRGGESGETRLPHPQLVTITVAAPEFQEATPTLATVSMGDGATPTFGDSKCVYYARDAIKSSCRQHEEDDDDFPAFSKCVRGFKLPAKFKHAGISKDDGKQNPK